MGRSETKREDAQSPLVIPTGVASLDEAIGIGGYPRGRVTEIFGPKKGDCKMALVLAALREAQRLGMTPAFVDAESVFNPRVAQVSGVDTSAVIGWRPNTLEDALGGIERYASGAPEFVIVGHLAALVDGDEIGVLMARRLSQSLRKLTATCHKNGTAIIFVTHREPRIAASYADMAQLEPLLGNALKFYSSLRIDVRQASGPDDKPVTIAKVVKNKMAAPFRKAEWR